MKKIFLIFIFFILFFYINSNVIYATTEFKFRKNVKYTITYKIGDNKIRILENVYFKGLWTSPPTELIPFMTQNDNFVWQNKMIVLGEFLKIKKDGSKDIYLIPIKNILEIKMSIKKSYPIYK